MIAKLLVCLLLWSGAAQAHLLPKQKATMNVINDAVYFVVSVPVSALVGVDDDRNGRLSAGELQQHTESIQSQFETRFQAAEPGNPSEPVLTMVLSPLTAGETGDSDYVVVMHRRNFNVTPTSITLHTDLFGNTAEEQQMTVSAKFGERTEVAILRLDAATHHFFRGPLATFSHFVRVGFEHVLGGWDHLLFLLTILVAGSGWRYWLSVVTSFTLAHSITLTLSVLDLVQIPAVLIEPGIAASIVLMAVLNFRTAHSPARVSLAKAGIVFGCGLLHGFGFAGAIGTMTLQSGNLIATLAGFNIGIELGQLLFVASAAIGLRLIRSIGIARAQTWMPASASALAACCGLYWLVERL